MKGQPKNKIFRTSRPFGYYMPDVDATIEKYNMALEEMKATIIDYKDRNKQQEKEIMRLQEELTEMHIQMNNIYVPEMSSTTEHMILDQFNSSMGRGSKLNDIVDPKDFGEEPKIDPSIEEDLEIPDISEMIITSKSSNKKKKTMSFDDLEII